MKITITGRNLSLTDGLKNGVEKKLGKLDKFFQAETPCNVTLSTQKDMQKIEVTIPRKGKRNPCRGSYRRYVPVH